MHGNVFEICHDGPPEPNSCYLRGGGWLDESWRGRAGHISSGLRTDRYNGSGLRLARVPAPQ
jgi:hypothetical protein